VLFGQRLAATSRPFIVSHPKRPDYKFLVSGRCAFPSRFAEGGSDLDVEVGETGRSDAPSTSKSVAQAPSSKPETSKRRLLLSAGPSSWPFSPTLVDPASDSYPLNAIVATANLGLGWEWRSPKMDLGVWVYGFFGKGQGELDLDTDDVEIP